MILYIQYVHTYYILYCPYCINFAAIFTWYTIYPEIDQNVLTYMLRNIIYVYHTIYILHDGNQNANGGCSVDPSVARNILRSSIYQGIIAALRVLLPLPPFRNPDSGYKYDDRKSTVTMRANAPTVLNAPGNYF